MHAEIISIGDELLIGQVVNTNASWISERLNSIGLDVFQMNAISDNQQHIIDSLNSAAGRVRVIILTGGLGPTNDDITKSTLVQFFESNLVFSQNAYKNIENLFAIRGLPVTDINKQQAYIPDNCVEIENKVGTAPGMMFEKNGIIYFSLPGVPFEMKEMMNNFVLPLLSKKLPLPAIVHKTILTIGIGESFLSEKISAWENQLPTNCKLAYLPSPGQVRLRISAFGSNAIEISNQMEEQTQLLKKIIPHYIYGFNEDTLSGIIGKILKLNNKTLVTAESCTGGFIAHLITSEPGSSNYFKGSVVAYSNKIKTELLKINDEVIQTHGAVSKEVVELMATNSRLILNADYSIASSGVAGPDGGSIEKPVGTVWLAVASPSGVVSEKFLFGNNRGRNILKASLFGLNMLRIDIQKNNST